ncbi:MAG: pyridoxamine 5'-phosphate oxidase [Oligoflexales bacterium]|nr:pyridoxamine 5'-phosphate oxidase [Oligoflexales bacterium]
MPTSEPMTIFENWFAKAKKAEPEYYNACSLATVSANGKPSSRIVLLKHADEQGFVFYTNLKSRKSLEIKESPHASLCFHWGNMKKQVRIEGKAELVSADEADEYFQSRPRGHRIGAWASRQSTPCGDTDLEQRVAYFTAKFGIGKIPRPDFWGGFRIKAERMEFWEDRKFRLHVRTCFELKENNWSEAWSKVR